jgi:hypothetical protein
MSGATIAQRLSAEALGTAFLLAAVVGPGATAERLAGGNAALALLCNTLPTGAILAVLTLMLGPVSGAHFVAQLIGAGAAVVAARDRLSGDPGLSGVSDVVHTLVMTVTASPIGSAYRPRHSTGDRAPRDRPDSSALCAAPTSKPDWRKGNVQVRHHRGRRSLAARRRDRRR